MPHDRLAKEILRFIGDRKSVPTRELLVHAGRNYFLLHLADVMRQLQKSGEILIDPTGTMVSLPQAHTL